jgi:hypothetical protein
MKFGFESRILLGGMQPIGKGTPHVIGTRGVQQLPVGPDSFS